MLLDEHQSTFDAECPDVWVRVGTELVGSRGESSSAVRRSLRAESPRVFRCGLGAGREGHENRVISIARVRSMVSLRSVLVVSTISVVVQGIWSSSYVDRSATMITL
jgi:hypothetical protein